MKSSSVRIASIALALCALFSVNTSAQSGGTPVRVCAACTNSTQIGQEAWAWRVNVGHYQMFIVTNPSPYNLARCFQRIYYPYYNVDTIAEHPMTNCPNPTPPLN